MNIFANCVPKCGSYLLVNAIKGLIYGKPIKVMQPIQRLKNCVESINEMKDSFLFGHQINNKHVLDALITNDFKIFLIVRDPRDMIVSRYYWERRMPEYQRYRMLQEMPKQEAYSHIIRHVEGPRVKTLERMDASDKKLDVAQYMLLFSDYWRNKNVVTIKFEDLVGSKGGGNDAKQLELLEMIKNTIGTDADCREVASKLFGKSPTTFRKGTIGQWKTELSAQNKQLINKIAKAVIEELQYE